MEYEDRNTCGSVISDESHKQEPWYCNEEKSDKVLKTVGALIWAVIAVLLLIWINITATRADALTGCTKVDYCYDYVDKDNYEIIKPSTGEVFYVDDFGKVFTVTHSHKGLDVEFKKTEIKSKHENGVILAFDSNRIICPCDTDECPHKFLKKKPS